MTRGERIGIVRDQRLSACPAQCPSKSGSLFGAAGIVPAVRLGALGLALLSYLGGIAKAETDPQAAAQMKQSVEQASRNPRMKPRG